MFEHNPISPVILRDGDLFDTVNNIISKLRYGPFRRRVYILVSSGARVPNSLMYIADRVVIGDRVVKSRDGKTGPI